MSQLFMFKESFVKKTQLHQDIFDAPTVNNSEDAGHHSYTKQDQFHRRRNSPELQVERLRGEHGRGRRKKKRRRRKSINDHVLNTEEMLRSFLRMNYGELVAH